MLAVQECVVLGPRLVRLIVLIDYIVVPPANLDVVASETRVSSKLEDVFSLISATRRDFDVVVPAALARQMRHYPLELCLVSLLLRWCRLRMLLNFMHRVAEASC